MNINNIVFLTCYASTTAIRFSSLITTSNPLSPSFEPSSKPPYFLSSTSKQTTLPSTPLLTSRACLLTLEPPSNYQEHTTNAVIHRCQAAKNHFLPSTSLFIPEDA